MVLILSNHGTGPIEPTTVPSINQWEMWQVNNKSGKIDLDQSVGYIDRFSPGEGSYNQTKGICFDDSTGCYLTIEKLTQAIGYISRSVIKKKFSIVACDACLMAGADVFVGLKPYAHYFVGSQEVELGLGYKYDRLIEGLINNTATNSEDLACHFVNVF